MFEIRRCDKYLLHRAVRGSVCVCVRGCVCALGSVIVDVRVYVCDCTSLMCVCVFVKERLYNSGSALGMIKE